MGGLEHGGGSAARGRHARALCSPTARLVDGAFVDLELRSEEDVKGLPARTEQILSS